MIPTKDESREMALLGESLRRGLGDEIRAAAGSGWDAESTENVRIAVGKYLSLACKHALALVAAELLVILAYGILFSNSAHRPEAAAVALALSITITAAGARRLWPAYVILPTLRGLPTELHQEVMRPVWGLAELACVGFNATLLVLSYRSWAVTLGVPATLVVWALWLAVPWAFFVSRRGSALLKIRGVQTAVLLVVAFATSGPEETISQPRSIAPTPSRPEPHRYDTPAASARGAGAASISAADRAREAELERARLARESEERRARQEAEAAERDAERRAELRRRYLPPASPTGAALPVALIAVDGERRPSQTLAGSLSKMLADAGVEQRTDLFTPAYVSSEHFRDLIDGRDDSRAEFSPEATASRIILLEVLPKTERQSPVAGVDMLRAEVALRVSLIDPASRSRAGVATYSGVGAAFRESEATAMAEERAHAELRRGLPSLVEALRLAR